MSFNRRISVIEYPRSGANWLLKMLSDYLRISYRDLDKKPESTIGSLMQKHFNIPPLARFNVRKNVNPFQYLEKTHVFTKIDTKIDKRIIYVIRDPRDVMISYYNYEKYFTRKVLKEKTGFVFDDKLSIRNELASYIKHRFQSNSFPYLSWPEHVNKALNDQRILFIKYEDLLLNPASEIMKTLDFLKLKTNNKRVANIVSHHSFQKEKRRLKETRQEYSIHLRKGISGEWKEHFNKEMLEYIYLNAKKQMKLFGYE